MRKKTFNLSVTSALALTMAACGPSVDADWDDGYTTYADRDTAVCVDKRTNKRLPDSECSRSHSAGWYYFGRNSAIPYYGESARGGSFVRPANRVVYHAPASSRVTRSQFVTRSSSSTVSRGGWGSSARSSGMHVSS